MKRQPKRSLGGLLGRLFFGSLLCLGLTTLIWVNEGRLNWADVADDSLPIIDDATGNEGDFVALTAPLTTAAPLGEPFIKPGPYALIERYVEQFVRDEEADEPENEWVSVTDLPAGSPAPIWQDGVHLSPQQVVAPNPQLGTYQLDGNQLEWPTLNPLTLTPVTVVETRLALTPSYLFSGTGTLDQPNLGDVRLSFAVVPTGERMTAFGVVNNGRLTPYPHRRDQTLYRILAGDRATAIAQLDNEYSNLLWGFRFLGWIGTWIGLMILASPVTGLLSWIPAIGNLSRRLINFLLLFVALLWTLIVATISIIAHNIWLLLAVILLIAGGTFWWQRQQKHLPK